MHIALCDDNIADRKQAERLIGRESDVRIHTTGSLYLDSFGHYEALMAAPMQYDLFFLDLTGGTVHGLDLAHMLREAGVTAPVALCSSRLNYQAMDPQPGCVFHITKPLKPEDISGCIDKALSIRGTLEKRFEIRCGRETHYISAGRVTSVTRAGRLSVIRFSDGSQLEMPGTPEDFYDLTESTQKFIFARKNTLVNLDYIAGFTMRRLTLSTGQSIPLNLSDWIFLRRHCPDKQA